MIPLNIISKLARSRSHVALSRNTLKTSAALWKLKEDCPDKSKHVHKQSSQPGEGSAKEICKMQNQGCSSKYDDTKCSDKPNVKQQKMPCGSLDVDDCLDAKKQGEGSSCGPLERDKLQGTHKTTVETCASQQQKSKGCDCPSYDTPKSVGGNVSKGCTQRKNAPCESKNSSIEKECPSEKEKCKRDDTSKRHNYCGPTESSYKELCKTSSEHRKKDPCETIKTSNTSSCEKETSCDNPCKPKNTSLKNKGCPNTCEEKPRPCETVQPSHCSKNECEEKSDQTCSGNRSCPEECEHSNANKHSKLDSCDTSRKSDCPDECSKEHNKATCPEDPCKKDIKIPILMSCCQVKAARECICKLKELQKQWEEVIAAQECGRKGDLGRTDSVDHARKKDRRSNMIYVVLSAIIATVVYLIYNNEDLEYKELLLEDEDEIKSDNDDDD